MIPRRLFLFAFLGLAFAWSSRAEEPLKRQALTVDGVSREFLIYAPARAKTETSPLVFGWHGHGGSMMNAARSYHIHTLWPEAIVVYPQGLNTPGRLTDPEGKKAGWQSNAGAMEDRDLKFFDALLKEVQGSYKVDASRIYSTGHSNGGGFTYLLWATRGDVFAAVAPSAAVAAGERNLLTPKPVLHIAGENDPLVKYSWQKLQMDLIRRVNQCGEGQPWELDSNCTYHPSKVDCPVVTAIHPGDHAYPKQAPEVIVKFFKAYTKKTAK